MRYLQHKRCIFDKKFEEMTALAVKNKLLKYVDFSRSCAGFDQYA
jgi:hypothetical protein